MSYQGSFYPLRRDIASADPVMFAYVLDTPAQHEGLQEEILGRIATIKHVGRNKRSALRLNEATRPTPPRSGRSKARRMRCRGTEKVRRAIDTAQCPSVIAPYTTLTVRHPLLTVPGGDSTQRELSMDIRYAFRSNGLNPACLLSIGRVVPSFGSRAP